MGCSENVICFFKTLLVFTLVLGTVAQNVQAIRPLGDGEEWLLGKFLAIQALSRGPVPSSGSSSCTYIPGKARRRCNLEESSDAGHESFPAIPNLVVDSTVASAPAGDSYNKHSSSS